MNPIHVSAKLIGRRGPLLEPFVLEPERPVRTLRDLLSAIVQHQIGEFLKRKQAARFLKIFTAEELDSGRETGRMIPGGQTFDQPAPDVEQAAAAAATAFQDGLFFVFINDEQIEQLDQEIPAIRDVLFVRLTPLVGG